MSLRRVFGDTEIKEKFKTTFSFPTVELKGQLVAPPLTANHAIVGQAFHKLMELRFFRSHKSKINKSIQWLDAFRAGELLSLVEQKDMVFQSNGETIRIEVPKTKSKTITVGYNGDIKKDRKEYAKFIKAENSNAENNYKKFLKDGILTDSLIRSALYVTRLRLTFGSAYPTHVDNESDLDVKDIRQLMQTADKFFSKADNCVINPTFGNYSNYLIGSADADFIIDDTLLDIKATKDLTFTRQFFDQTIYYYILSLMYGINNNKKLKRPINNVAIYFARHGVLWQMAIKDIADKKTFTNFKEWFVNYTDKHPQNRRRH
jgi:hypothetical protein